MSRAPRCLTTAMSHGDSRTTSSIVGRDDRPAAVAVGAGLAAPAEDHQVGFLLRGGLDDAGRGMAADPHERVDDRPLGHVVQHLLEQPSGLAGARRALGQRHALGHLDDAQRGELAGPRLQQRGADPDQLLRGERVRDRDQDPAAGSGSAGHRAAPRRRRLVPALHEVRLEQLELARLALDALLGRRPSSRGGSRSRSCRPARSRSASAPRPAVPCRRRRGGWR